MLADAAVVNEDGDEAWSNWICPKCMSWWRLDDYELLDDTTPPSSKEQP